MSDACAAHMAALLREALASQPFAALAVSGGSSPKPMFAALAASGLDWSRVHLFWVDERCVPPGDPLSNYGMTEPLLIRPSGIPASNVHRIQGELEPDRAAGVYEEEIRALFRLEGGALPVFDVVHCGIGPDGHTASLFPGEPLIDDRKGIAAAVYVGKMQQWRVTLLPGVLLAARHTVFYAPGSGKEAILHAIREGPYDPLRLPAQLVARHAPDVAWFPGRV